MENKVPLILPTPLQSNIYLQKSCVSYLIDLEKKIPLSQETWKWNKACNSGQLRDQMIKKKVTTYTVLIEIFKNQWNNSL